MMDDMKAKIEWLSQFQDGQALPNGYESLLYLPNRRVPCTVKILQQDETRYLVATPTFGSPFSTYPEAWWISKESAVKNKPEAQIFAFKPQTVQAERDTEKYTPRWEK